MILDSIFNVFFSQCIFSIRENANDKRSRGSYSLSLCYQLEYHHYIIQQTSSGRLQIASANKSTNVTQFGSIVQVNSSESLENDLKF